MKYLLSLCILAACGGTYHLPTPATAPNTRLVKNVLDYADELSWQRSGYYHVTDPVGDWPWFVVIGTDDTACPVFTHQEVHVPKKWDFYTCSLNWRIAR